MISKEAETRKRIGMAVEATVGWERVERVLMVL